MSVIVKVNTDVFMTKAIKQFLHDPLITISIEDTFPKNSQEKS